MSANTFSARRIATAAAMVGVTATIGLGMASSADAAAPAEVTVKITQMGDYTATVCVGDVLKARCLDGIKKGQSRTFTVAPERGTPVLVAVVVQGGGFTEKSIVSSGTQLEFEIAGSEAEPIMRQV